MTDHTAHKSIDGADRSNGSIWRTVAKFFGFGRNGTSVRDTLEELIEETPDEEIEIDHHERTLIRNVLGLRDLTAVDVMVPRADIVAISADSSFEEVVEQMSGAAHSRFPVFRGSLDDVVGMVHIKDVLNHVRSGDVPEITDLIRNVLFIAPTVRAIDLLQEMRLTRQHLALVVDEFGGIDGIITVEDLVEEIVGEITDEHDVEEGPKFIHRSDGTVTADARATVEEFEEEFGAVLDDEEREELDTLGGLIFTLAGHIATRGEVVRHPSGFEFAVVEADPRRIKTIQIRLPQDARSDDDEAD